MAILTLIDLDLEDDLAKVHKDVEDTIKYLLDVKESIEQRVLNGENIKGLKVGTARGKRYITPPGFKYLEKVLGEDVVYTTVKKEITITKLEALLKKEEIEDLMDNGYIAYQEGKPNVYHE